METLLHKKISDKIKNIPDYLLEDLSDFIDFLIYKSKNEANKKKPKFGILKGEIEMSDDFDEPLEDFKEYQ